MRCSHLLYSAILFEKNALTTVRSLCKKQNKMRNKFLQIEYIHPYIIWCIDSFLSVISSFSIFLFSHYLINININFNQQRYVLLIAVISSIVWTGICKTYEGIIRYSTLALNPQLHSRSATYIKRNGLLIRKITIKSSRPFQCAYHPLTP